MQAAPDSGGGANYQFVFAGLPENVEYYVTAGPLVSSHFKLRVVDLPSVKDIRVTYHYPVWTGMKPAIEENSGDLRAIEGTDAAIEVKMDRPLKDGQLTLDNGQVIPLTGGAGNTYKGSIHLEKDGAYHLAETGEGQQVRLSEDSPERGSCGSPERGRCQYRLPLRRSWCRGYDCPPDQPGNRRGPRRRPRAARRRPGPR